MTKLDKTELAAKDELAQKLEKATKILEYALDQYTTSVRHAFATLQQAVADVNEVVDEIDGWRSCLTDEMTLYYEEKSERWQESDAGQRYSNWLEMFNGLEVERIELEEPEPPEVPDLSPVVDELKDLPATPNQ